MGQWCFSVFQSSIFNFQFSILPEKGVTGVLLPPAPPLWHFFSAGTQGKA
jgi:hypothetical protein